MVAGMCLAMRLAKRGESDKLRRSASELLGELERWLSGLKHRIANSA